MPRRCNESPLDSGPPRKKSCSLSSSSGKDGQFLIDISGKQWKLGKTVGEGGFGEIYLATDILTGDVKTDCPYVAKIESHRSGPLFVEVHCYLRIAKESMINEWMQRKKLNFLGMPHYVASGSHMYKGERYRFLILPHFAKDLENILQERKILNLKTVLSLSIQVMDVLEYIHEKGYIHCDIKGSNILLNNSREKGEVCIPCPRNLCSRRNPFRHCRAKRPERSAGRYLRQQQRPSYIDNFEDSLEGIDGEIHNLETKSDSTTTDQIYLMDYGLACKYLTSTGEHKPFIEDERKAHAGTLLFCSRDAHQGVCSRRSDLECLGYNMIYWLTGSLPWSSDVEDPELVHRKKRRAIKNIDEFLNLCFKEYQYPRFLLEYFESLKKLQFQDKPDYHYFNKLFRQTLTEHGYSDDSRFDFENTRPWNQKQKIKLSKENDVFRMPLTSNIPVPRLRKEIKEAQQMNWSKILFDPKVILKQRKEKKVVESNLCDLDIARLNPTYAMMEVFDGYMEQNGASPSYKGDCVPEKKEGFTPAMMQVWKRMQERKDLECEHLAVSARSSRRSGKTKKGSKDSPTLKVKTRIKSNPGSKKDSSPLKKVRSFPIGRTYSLRG